MTEIIDVGTELEAVRYSLEEIQSSDKFSRLAITYANGVTVYYHYSDLHQLLFSPEGDRMMLVIGYSPKIIFVGRNLNNIAGALEGRGQQRLSVYRRGYHADIVDTSKAIITAAYYYTIEKVKEEEEESQGDSDTQDKPREKTQQVIIEALPEIPDLLI